ncbi:hypothetical protein RB195_016995 [Necator americanus]|uniref:Uncharacterized protein n=1 Tax=Necator americanus TaxID=51031 RepID=A0ABR1C329_NECAM
MIFTSIPLCPSTSDVWPSNDVWSYRMVFLCHPELTKWKERMCRHGRKIFMESDVAELEADVSERTRVLTRNFLEVDLRQTASLVIHYDSGMKFNVFLYVEKD